MPVVTMYATATCPYCIRAKRLLESKGADIHEIRVDLNPEERQIMMTRTGRRTVPQIYVGQTHVGGCDELMALEAKGELDTMLAAP